MTAMPISVFAPESPRSSRRGWPKMRYFRVPKGYSTVDRRSRIRAGVARWCMRLRASSSICRLNMRCGDWVQRFHRTGAAVGGLGLVEHRAVVAMHPAELGDGFMVRIKPPQQPNQLHVAPALRLQSSGTAQLMQISIQIKLQEIARILAQPPCLGRLRPLEAQLRHRQTIDK